MYLGDFPAAQQALQAGEALAREMGYPDELAMILVLGGQIAILCRRRYCSSQSVIWPKPSL